MQCDSLLLGKPNRRIGKVPVCLLPGPGLLHIGRGRDEGEEDEDDRPPVGKGGSCKTGENQGMYAYVCALPLPKITDLFNFLVPRATTAAMGKQLSRQGTNRGPLVASMVVTVANSHARQRYVGR
jgi:hypothetical protein